MAQLVTAVNGYDPFYKDKLRKVVEVIQHELLKQKQFSAALVNRHLEFGGTRHLRLLVRAGFLQIAGRTDEKDAEDAVQYRKLEAWPPPAAYFEGAPIGAAYYIQKWFRFRLVEWIIARMRELESKEGVYSLEGRHDGMVAMDCRIIRRPKRS
jgi:hypothetical protein